MTSILGAPPDRALALAAQSFECPLAESPCNVDANPKRQDGTAEFNNEGRQESHTDLVFIGGIHGVGKTTYCRTLAPYTRLRHLTAGDLIRAGGSIQIEKSVADIDLNQARLIAALDARKAAGEDILLDGHFCLLSTTFTIVPIPLEVFGRIAPTRILLMEADAGEVEARLRKRDAKGLDLRLIQQFAIAERAHATAISSALRVPLKIIGTTTPIEEVHQFWSSFLYVHSLKRRPNLRELTQTGILRAAPRGFERLSDAAFEKLLEIANVNQRLIVD